MNKLKVGIVGCGKQAPKHIAGLKAVDGCEIEVVVADIDKSLALQVANQYGVGYANSVDELFENEDIDAIDICTPVPVHYELCMRAINAGKHFFCEKPLVTCLDQAESIERARATASLVGMVGYIYRFAPVIAEYRRLSLLEEFNSSFGKPVLANFKIGGRGSHQLWKHQKARGGGAMNEMLVHMLDLALWFFGTLESIKILSLDRLLSERTINGQVEKVDAEDIVLVELKMQSGVQVNIQADMLTPSFTQFFEVQGERGTYNGSIQSSYQSSVYLQDDLDIYSKGLNQIAHVNTNLFQSQMSEFAQAICNPRSPVTSSVIDSINLLTVMNKLNNGKHEN